MDKLFAIQESIGSIRTPEKPKSAVQGAGQTAGGGFKAVLEQELDKVKFSAHAEARLKSRNIRLNDSDLSKISSAVQKAEAKGSRESLILMDDLAFVVSVRNRTVITAMDGTALKENIFTNIDSAVII